MVIDSVCRLYKHVWDLLQQCNKFTKYYSPEEKIRQLEKKVNELIEESCFANSTGDLSLVYNPPFYSSQLVCLLQLSFSYWSMNDEHNFYGNSSYLHLGYLTLSIRLKNAATRFIIFIDLFTI